MPFLPAGEYTVTAGQKVSVGSRRACHPASPTNGARRFRFERRRGYETVNVEASAALLQTETSTVGTVIDSSKIVDFH